MSEEQLKAFIAKVQADTSLQEQLKAEGADPVAIAKAAGFSITTEDLNTQRQTLSDAELEGVAGGACRSTSIALSMYECPDTTYIGSAKNCC
ncbi:MULTISPECIES: Nif11-like leader peptide family natural product precursor [Prochlorococcus]|uniref:Nif11-like leader peptide family natural product precursor n=2 Tax=Prochlorococcaceae TaxID=2881426 RepID=UPI0007B34B80|nr:Nif11-like leader peptide family natural product precursor [Prochlorococcus marinus]KZR83595.1 Nitrogen fixation protein of unknown function [Prochlorococcus marinus str. MIT 1327]